MLSTFAKEVVFVDDDPELRHANAQLFELAGYSTRVFSRAKDALEALSPDFPGVIVSDIRMPAMDGMEFLRLAKQIDPDLSFILITGHGDVPLAIEAMKLGAFDFITKPFARDHILASVSNAVQNRHLVLENRRLRNLADIAEAGSSPIIGDSDVMVRLRETISLLAKAKIDVLVQGETGTGKELAARVLYGKSDRRGQPFVAVNCAALPEAIAESELFGQGTDEGRSGVPRSIGRIEASDKGVLFLDEVDSMPLSMQAKLLRVLEEREVHPVGAPRARSVDLRVIAATKVDLGDLVRKGAFRSDLYYRLNVVCVPIPPLRERRADIPLLFATFAEQALAKSGQDRLTMTDGIRRHLATHDWPGNVRELGNFAHQVVLGLSEGGKGADDRLPLPERMDRIEAELIRQAVLEASGSVREVLEILRIPRKTFYDKVSRYGIDLDHYRKR